MYAGNRGCGGSRDQTECDCLHITMTTVAYICKLLVIGNSKLYTCDKCNIDSISPVVRTAVINLGLAGKRSEACTAVFPTAWGALISTL